MQVFISILISTKKLRAASSIDSSSHCPSSRFLLAYIL